MIDNDRLGQRLTDLRLYYGGDASFRYASAGTSPGGYRMFRLATVGQELCEDASLSSPSRRLDFGPCIHQRQEQMASVALVAQTASHGVRGFYADIETRTLEPQAQSYPADTADNPVCRSLASSSWAIGRGSETCHRAPVLQSQHETAAAAAADPTCATRRVRTH